MSQIKSRKTTSTKSAMTAIIQNFVKIIIQFIFRSFFIRYLSVDLLGVNSAIAGVLNLLSVTELGLSSVITFNLYKPVAEGNQEKINAIIKFYRKFYMVIGGIVLVLGLCLLPFLDVLIKDVSTLDVNVHLVFVLALVSTVASYFCSYRCVLFTAYQDQYKANVINTIIVSTCSIIQILTIILFKDYYAYLIAQFLSALLGNIAIHAYTKKAYSSVKINSSDSLNAEDKKEIYTNIKGMVYHKISAAVIQGTDSLIISAFIGATLLGKYSNFSLFTTNIVAIFALLSVSLMGAVGNLVAEGNPEKSYKIYNILKLIFFWLAGFCSICLLVLLNPAIEVWASIGKWDANTVWTFDMFTIIIIVVNFYLYSSRIISGTFRECVGHFDKDRFKGIIEAAINVITSLLLVQILGIAGVLLGTIISCVCTSLWVDPYMAHKYHFKKPLRKHFLDFTFYTLVTILAGSVTYFVCSLIGIGGISGLFIKLGLCIIIPNLIFLLCYFRTNEFKCLVVIIKDFLQKFRRKKELDIEQESETVTNSVADTESEVAQINDIVEAEVESNDSQN